MLKYIKAKRDQFEKWVAGCLPGWKTKIVMATGAAGTAALVIQEYISGLPLEAIITPTKLAIANAILFTVGYWTKRLSDKY